LLQKKKRFLKEKEEIGTDTNLSQNNNKKKNEEEENREGGSTSPVDRGVKKSKK